LNTEAFCYFGLMRMREALERIVALLPEARQRAARGVLESCASLPEAEVRRKLLELRAAEQAEMRRKLERRMPAGSASPALQRWMRARLDSDGREDHQS
jgi:hypothetical protein